MAHKYKLKEIEVGDVKVSGGVKSTVISKDPETGAISWDIDYVPAFDSTYKEFNELNKSITKLSRKVEDTTIDQIAKDVRESFNAYRTHLRKNYSEDYKKMTMEESDVKEMSTSGGAGGYLGKYAFRKPKKKKVEEKQNPGATLGPGPKASEDGVKDNAYIKQFKYRLVPKDKNGNYVQKGSGLEVKNI
jgi:hypothetical protein